MRTSLRFLSLFQCASFFFSSFEKSNGVFNSSSVNWEINDCSFAYCCVAALSNSVLLVGLTMLCSPFLINHTTNNLTTSVMFFVFSLFLSHFFFDFTLAVAIATASFSFDDMVHSCTC